ncbi:MULTISPECIES: PH domain-containing protein [unclassified Modestobacter]|uniref:PH domain-containing protein n=1 Tax=unclassified Modestobacter TaxID=2643866 RepID=UPI0022AB18EB|nr:MULTISPECIES: PH domain-containing protein [unclassified Modestobacter]MCZ2824020.1 PH domain-containing protein [Modestobacter sp. VKM Ac-2981]MCZ2852265.1 PH domain-containing protein [Modestobacter sp. VKM Ac-2982]
MAVARMRMSRISLVPVLFLTICVLPVTVASPWAFLLLLVPLALAVWVFRVGVDVGDDGITARSLVARRTIAWDDLAGVRVGERADLWLVTTAGTQVQLPVLRARDLPRLAALSGGRIPAL